MSRSVSKGRRRSQSAFEGRKKRHKARDLERRVLRAHLITFGGYHSLVTSVGVFEPSFPDSITSTASEARISAAPSMSGGAVCVVTHGQLRPVGLMLGASPEDSNRVFIFAGSPAFWSAFCFLFPESDVNREFLTFAKNKLQTDPKLQKLVYFSGYVPRLATVDQKPGGPLIQFIRAAPRASQ